MCILCITVQIHFSTSSKRTSSALPSPKCEILKLTWRGRLGVLQSKELGMPAAVVASSARARARARVRACVRACVCVGVCVCVCVCDGECVAESVCVSARSRALVYMCHIRTHTGIYTCLHTRWHAHAHGTHGHHLLHAGSIRTWHGPGICLSGCARST